MVNVDVIAGNRILAALPEPESLELRRNLHPVELSFKEPIVDRGRPTEYVYFPLNCVISLVMDMKDGFTVEAGTIGREGMAGLGVVLTVTKSPWRALCQIAGEALRMRASDFLTHVRHGEALHIVLLKYTNAVMGSLAQTAACNRAHPLEERMCRWLLMTHDRVDADDFPLTQEFLGQMLGVRRPSVSIAGRTLQKAGLIRYSRGRIVIVDRPGLEQATCECYAIVKTHFEDSLGG